MSRSFTISPAASATARPRGSARQHTRGDQRVDQDRAQDGACRAKAIDASRKRECAANATKGKSSRSCLRRPTALRDANVTGAKAWGDAGGRGAARLAHRGAHKFRWAAAPRAAYLQHPVSPSVRRKHRVPPKLSQPQSQCARLVALTAAVPIPKQFTRSRRLGS